MHRKLITAMRILGVTESSLAEAVSVDRSLVNKWKRGSREIGSEALASIVAALTECYLRSDEFTKNKFRTLLPKDASQEKDAVARYFLDNSIPAESLPAEDNRFDSYIFRSPGKAMAAFFDEISGKRGGVLKLYLGTEDATPELAEYLRVGLARGTQIKLVLSPSLSPGGGSLLGILGLCFNKRINIYLRELGARDFGFFLYGTEAALTFHKSEGKAVYAEFFNDVIRTEYLDRMFSLKLGQAVPVFDEEGDLRTAAAILGRNLSKSPVFVVSALPEFFGLSAETVLELLCRNGVTGAQKEKAAVEYAMMRSVYLKLLSKNKIFEAYLPGELTKAENEGKLKVGLLSDLAGTPIFAEEGLMERVLGERRSVQNASENSEPGLVLGSRNALPAGIGFLVKRYELAALWETGESSSGILIVTSPLCVEAVFAAAERFLKDSVAKEEKDEAAQGPLRPAPAGQSARSDGNTL